MKFQLYIALLLLAVFTSCSESSDTQKESLTNTKCLSDTMFKLIQLDTVKYEQVRSSILLTGRITANEDKIVKVYPLVGGYVQDLKVELGDYVKQGQVLAVIKSTEVAQVQNELIIAESNYYIAEKNLQVTQDMFTAGLASERELVVAKKELQKASGELRRVKETMAIYGINDYSIYTIKSPISGFITDKNIAENTQFRMENTTHLFTIANLEHVWVTANVFESDINKIKVGETVEVTTLSYPDKVFVGKVDKIFNVLDPVSHVMKIRVQLENKDYLLKPEMYASIKVYFNNEEKCTVVPPNSVVFDNNKEYVVIYQDNCHMKISEIQRIDNNDKDFRISNGAKEGDIVVCKNQLLIYNFLKGE
ncbi:MAG: efflux RND transporter periplasmic adaptor subunit [Cytophagaceae bacterium]